MEDRDIQVVDLMWRWRRLRVSLDKILGSKDPKVVVNTQLLCVGVIAVHGSV